MQQRYRIVWRRFTRDTRLFRRFGLVGDEAYVPFLVHGPALERMERERTFQATDRMIFFGILVGWQDIIDNPIAGEGQRGQLKRMLRGFRDEAGCDSMGTCILAAAATIREELGPRVSARALRTGLHLTPESAELRRALIADISRHARDERGRIEPGALEELDSLCAAAQPTKAH